jgi:hypothetical protein
LTNCATSIIAPGFVMLEYIVLEGERGTAITDKAAGQPQG